MFVVGDAEDGHALSVAARDADVGDGGADHLALVSDQHELLARLDGEARHYAAIALRSDDVGDALSAAIGAAIFVSRRPLAITVFGDGEQELLLVGDLRVALFTQSLGAAVVAPPGRAE